MDKTISAAEANRQFSRVLREVREQGTTYAVTSHGEPVARITPPAQDADEKQRRDAAWKNASRALENPARDELGTVVAR